MNPQEPFIPLVGAKKPRVRARDNLSTIQITDEQKESIDQAYNMFKDKEGSQVNKGEFLQLLALDFLSSIESKPELGGEDELPPPSLSQL